MLLYPAVDLLKTKVDSKYTLAILASKRARDIIDGKPMLTINETYKPLSVATSEISEDLISYRRSAAPAETAAEEVSEEDAAEAEAVEEAAEEAAEAAEE